jgi:dTDP-4-dehydrorhamnose 3,5-epimerase
MDPLGIDGAWLSTPRIHPDSRGSFHEAFRGGELAETIGHPLTVAQVNCAVSRRGALRGVHFCDVPPGQAKYVMCVSGAIKDVVVDLREGSPSFGEWAAVTLDDREHAALYLSEGLGHAFMTLTDEATVTYLCSTPYAPGAEHGIHPLDPALGIDWPAGIEPILSPKDASAPTLEQARRAGLLPRHADCLAYTG